MSQTWSVNFPHYIRQALHLTQRLLYEGAIDWRSCPDCIIPIHIQADFNKNAPADRQEVTVTLTYEAEQSMIFILEKPKPQREDTGFPNAEDWKPTGVCFESKNGAQMLIEPLLYFLAMDNSPEEEEG
jgi:hypothetical protein